MIRPPELSRTRQATRWAWLAGGGFALLAVWVRRAGLLPGDAQGLQFVQSHLVLGLRGVTRVGSGDDLVELIAFLGLGLVLAWACRRWLRPLLLIGVMGLVPVLEWTLKILVHRQRPGGDGLGFPSGHAFASLTLALLVCVSLWRGISSSGKVWIVVVATVFVLGVAGSRLGAGVHWPSDILGGWLAALAYGIWTIPLVRR